MSVDTKKSTPREPTRVDLTDPSEVSYRRREFGCTEQQLRQAVAAVGESAVKVGQYLKSKSTPPKGKAQKYE